MNFRHPFHSSFLDGSHGTAGAEDIGTVEALDAAQARNASNLMLLRHWRAIQEDGISATEFIAFLKPLADLDGITVSHFYAQPTPMARGRASLQAQPGGEAGHLTPKNLKFVLNTEGGISVESNFVEL